MKTVAEVSLGQWGGSVPSLCPSWADQDVDTACEGSWALQPRATLRDGQAQKKSLAPRTGQAEPLPAPAVRLVWGLVLGLCHSSCTGASLWLLWY